MIDREYKNTCPHCGGFRSDFKPVGGLEEEAAKVAKAIFEGTFTGDIAPEMVSLIADKLTEAILQGYEKSLESIEYGSPDWIMIENLQRNVYQFSAAKNYHQLKSLTLALKDESGNIVSFSDFKKLADDINSQYNVIWLQTEYDTAIGSAQMASKWTDFPDDSNLTYSTVKDDRVRESHEKLEGVTKLKSDKFWNKYYPPNGWRCRCTVIESDNVETPDHLINYPPVSEMWQTNTAKAGLLFPKSHPYFKGVPDDVLKQSEELIEKLKQ